MRSLALTALLLAACSPSFDGYHFALAHDAGDQLSDGGAAVPPPVVLGADANTRDDEPDAAQLVEPDSSVAEVVDAGTAASDASTGEPDASPAVDAGPPLPSCSDKGFEVYRGGCHCDVTSCVCMRACVFLGATVCCESNAKLTPICECVP